MSTYVYIKDIQTQELPPSLVQVSNGDLFPQMLLTHGEHISKIMKYNDIDIALYFNLQ